MGFRGFFPLRGADFGKRNAFVTADARKARQQWYERRYDGSHAGEFHYQRNERNGVGRNV